MAQDYQACLLDDDDDDDDNLGIIEVSTNEVQLLQYDLPASCLFDY